MHDYYEVQKLLETYNQNYTVSQTKIKPRLSQMVIDGKIDEQTRKKLIKEIYEIQWRN